MATSGSVVADREILGRVVLPVDPVADVGRLGECLETVQQPGRHVQGDEVLVVEHHRHAGAERRRAGPGVHQHVQHHTPGAAHEFALTGSATPVHAPDRASPRAGLAVLDERVGVQPGVAPYRGVEGPGEQAAVVPVRGRDEQQHAVQLGVFHLHDASRLDESVAQEVLPRANRVRMRSTTRTPR
jgi:hypothetical protein